jgi:hypothetical protein
VVRFLLRDVDLPFVDLNKPMSCDIPATGATNDAKSSSRLPAASLDVRDRQYRTPLMHAIMSGNAELVAELVELRTALTIRDKYWGWTPLHFAAYAGNVEVVQLLLGRNANPHLLSDIGWDAHRVAEENHCTEAAALLREFVLCEPAQCVLPKGKTGSQWASSIWIGHHRAADARWATVRAFRAVISIYEPGAVPERKHAWLAEAHRKSSTENAYTSSDEVNSDNINGSDTDDDEDDVIAIRVDIAVDDSDESKVSWERLLIEMPRILRFIDRATKEKRELLIHDETGVSTSAAIVIMHMMVKRRLRRIEATERVKCFRREVLLSPSFEKGLKMFEERLERRRLERLEERLRNSSVFSIAF